MQYTGLIYRLNNIDPYRLNNNFARPSLFSENFIKSESANILSIIKTQYGKRIRMSINKPMFGPVVLEIACGIVRNIILLYHG